MTRVLAFLAGVSAVLTGAALAAPKLPLADGGKGLVGKWTLVWRLDEKDETTNRFRQTLGQEPTFPFRARTLPGPTGPRVLLFDADGNIDGEIPLAPGERAMVAGDGAAHLVWSPDPLRTRHFTFRFFREGNPECEWEAVAPGEPALFAPDGSLFVITAPDTGVDRFQRAFLQQGGTVEVVNDKGEIRGEMPIYPAYVRLTGDGARLAMLHANELVVLRRDGVLDWSVDVPIDAVVARDGHSQLEAAGRVIVVCGTGAVPPGQTSGRSLHGERRGTLRAFTNEGALLWKRDQSSDDRLWFQISLALSDDGTTLATFHSDGRKTVVCLFDAMTGERFWERSVSRRLGTHALSVSPDGQLIVLASGDDRTFIVAWDREGAIAWEGVIPLPSRLARIAARGLLVADRWIVRLEPDEAP